MSTTKRSTNLFHLTILIALIFLTILFIVYGFANVFSNWVLTTGTVMYFQNDSTCIPIEGTSNIYDCSFNVRYRAFKPDGTSQPYIVRVNNVIGPKVNNGDTVYIQYDANDNSKVVYGNISFKTFGLLYLTMGAIMLLLTMFYWVKVVKK